MKPSVLHIIMYLFHYHMQNDIKLNKSTDELLPHLEEAGFQRPNIIQALNWLSNLQHDQELALIEPSQQSFRVFTKYECERINAECRGFILSLEQQGILNPHTRERVINQVLELEHEGIDLSLIKWVTLLVLFSLQEKHELEYMQHLVFDESSEGSLH